MGRFHRRDYEHSQAFTADRRDQQRETPTHVTASKKRVRFVRLHRESVPLRYTLCYPFQALVKSKCSWHVQNEYLGPKTNKSEQMNP